MKILSRILLALFCLALILPSQASSAASKSKTPSKSKSTKSSKKSKPKKTKPKAKPKAKKSPTLTPTPRASATITPTPAPTEDAKNASSFSANEKALVVEINRMRSNPKAYAEGVLGPLRMLYNGKMLQYPDEYSPTKTEEGLSALEECMEVLSRTQPMQPLSLNWKMGEAAKDHARDLGPKGDTSHKGSDGKGPSERVQSYITCKGLCCGECLSFGPEKGERILWQLLIDDGVRSRGHRELLIDPQYNSIGVAIGEHKGYKFMAVLDFGVNCR